MDLDKKWIALGIIVILAVMCSSFILIQTQEIDYSSKKLPNNLLSYSKTGEVIGDEAINQIKNLHTGDVVSSKMTRALLGSYHSNNSQLLIYFSAYKDNWMAKDNLSLMINDLENSTMFTVNQKNIDGSVYIGSFKTNDYLLWRDGRALYWVTIMGNNDIDNSELIDSLEEKMKS